MAALLPVLARLKPADLASTPNGQLADWQLTTLVMGGNRSARVHPEYARALRALMADFQQAMGFPLTHIGDYRSYQAQVNLFVSRYRRTYPWDSNYYTRDKYWDGSWWYKFTGAVAATPGSSDHGFGIALDGAYWMNGAARNVLTNYGAWQWIRAYLTGYGLCWAWDEEDEEPWHWHLFQIGAPSVIAYENAVNPPPPPPPPPPPEVPTFDPLNRQYSLWPLNPQKEVLRLGAEGDAVKYLQGVLRNEGSRFASWFLAMGYIPQYYGNSMNPRWLQMTAFRDMSTNMVVDGKYGEVSVNTVKFFQSAFANTAFDGKEYGSMVPDGVVGNAQTWPVIDSWADGQYG